MEDKQVSSEAGGRGRLLLMVDGGANMPLENFEGLGIDTLILNEKIGATTECCMIQNFKTIGAPLYFVLF